MRAVAPLLALLLTACGQSPAADILRVALWPIPVPESLTGPDKRERTAEWDGPNEAVAPAEPALALSLGSRRAIATLIQAQGERRLWRTRGGVVVATDGARVVATAGLKEVLVSTRFDGPDPLAWPTEPVEGETDTRRVVDLMRAGRDPSGMRFGLMLDCRLREASREEALVLEERCRGDARFINRFWADPASGAVYRSEQWIGDTLPPLVLEVLTPPAS